MFNFKAYFLGKDVYINEKFRYDSNEILTDYLDDSRAKYILKSDFVDRLKSFKPKGYNPITLSSLYALLEYKLIFRFKDYLIISVL